MKSTKLYHQHLNESISLVADRVLESRQELKGYFKNQIMKLQREQRILEETETANKLKAKKIAEENGVSTKEEIEKYLRANRLFGADKEESPASSSAMNQQQPSSPRPSAPQVPSNSKLIPKPPAAPLLPNTSLSPRAGNMVTMTAASKRKIRGTQSTVMNLDDICEELLTVCQLDGKKYRLVSLKKMLQGHVLSQLCLLTLIQSDLLKINQKFQSSSSASTAQSGVDFLLPLPPFPLTLQHEHSAQSERTTNGSENTSGTATRSLGGGTGGTVGTKTKKESSIRHVYVRDNLRMISDDDDTEKEEAGLSKRLQYISTGLGYAQSVSLALSHIHSSTFSLD
jgi:hypothetical protein